MTKRGVLFKSCERAGLPHVRELIDCIFDLKFLFFQALHAQIIRQWTSKFLLDLIVQRRVFCL